MNTDKRILNALIQANTISQDRKLKFEDKMQAVLLEIINCMGTQKGSIMVTKGRKSLEVAAATNPHIIGMKQTLDTDSPSSWVVKNKMPLYIDSSQNSELSQKFNHYKGDAFMVAPVLSSNKVIAVLSVTEKVGSDSFSLNDQELFLNLAGHIISALENDRLNQALKKNRRTLQEKNRQLKKLEQSKTELFNMLVHDLKTPIAEIVANHDILSYTVSEENKEYVVAAQTGCDNLFRMISDLLDIARLKDGTIKLVYEKIDAKELVKDALSRLPGIAQQKSMQLLESYPDIAAEVILEADRTLILRVMQNLLINAISYSSDGDSIIAGLTLPEEGKISFFVEDNGPGVPPELQTKIFEKFVQVNGQVIERKGSVGLGLSFCKIAAEAHGGNIHVESDGTTGSRFIVTLPINTK